MLQTSLRNVKGSDIIFREIKQEINKFCNVTCKIMNIFVYSVLLIILSTFARFNAFLLFFNIGLFLGVVTTWLNINMIKSIHNLLIINYNYRKMIIKVFKLYLNINHKINNEKITQLHLDLGNKYMEEYYCNISKRRRNKKLDMNDDLLIKLDLGQQEIKLAPCWININLGKNNRLLISILCLLFSVTSAILMVILGPLDGVFIYCLSLLSLLIILVTSNIRLDKLSERFFRDSGLLSDFLYLNSFDDLFVD